MALNMTKAERERFLADVHVGIVSVGEAGRGPLAAPIWYRYEPGGEVVFVTGESSRKAGLLRAAGRASLCVQTETAPYRYVSVEGPVTLGEPEYERDIRQIAHRYLGPEFGERYLAQTGGEGRTAGSVLVRLKPERWLTVDYGKAGRG